MPIIATAEGNPYTHAVLDNILHNVLVYRYGAAMASLFSWHSYRSGLCTALFAAGCPDAVNQLICLVLSATAATAVVRFLHDRAADGRPYQDERLPLDRLQPL